MSPSNSKTKRLWFRSLIWSGLLLGSRCDDTPPPGGTQSDLLVIGTPTLTTTSTTTSTITVTVTIAYSPTLAPGNLNYTLIGCYAQPTSNGGHIFGTEEHDACSDKVPPENLTIDGCLDGCASLAPKDQKNGRYTYVGLKNGSECICGLQLPQNTPNLTSEDCQAPCPGDGKLSCGGEDNFVVYSLIAGDGESKSAGESRSSTGSSKTKSQQSSTDSAHPVSSSVDDKGEGSADEAHHSTLPDSAAPGAAKKPISTPAVAAITGSFSGAIVIGAGFFLCIRWRKKKKRIQEEHVQNMLERRGVPAPNPILTSSADKHANTNTSVANVASQRRAKPGSQDKDIRLTVDGDLIPTTPALESGGRYPSGLHRRTSAAGLPSNAGAQRPQSKDSDKDTLYGNLLGEVRAGPAGSSSGVQWRQTSNTYNNKSNVPSAHRRTISTQNTGIASPPPSAKVDSLGERAWHRRKVSTPFPPPGVWIPVGLEAQQNAARRGPPSGPPTTPLPPTPMRKPGVSGGRIQHPTQRGAARLPLRPRRSFDTMTFPENYPTEEGITGLGIGLPSTSGSKLGMSHANTSTPSLGRYGSISKPRPPTRDYFEESPVLGRYLDSAYDQWGNPKPKKDTSKDINREPTIPILPPVKPGEKFDPKSWRGTIYAESTSSGRTADGDRDEDREPKSASSVGTSILYSPSEFDRHR
ncbi:hypothetical protein GGR57DRAFT_226656 [Xylariaceae sp. FL1272]|nr:hypothetical protein GGR57DRAFT_226656 [Xylariaceae sp. FL1272]